MARHYFYAKARPDGERQNIIGKMPVQKVPSSVNVVMTAALHDPNPHVRRAAISALGRAVPTQKIMAFLVRIGKNDPDVKNRESARAAAFMLSLVLERD